MSSFSHANIIIGNEGQGLSWLKDKIEKDSGLKLKEGVNFTFLKKPVFKIEDSHSLRKAQSRIPHDSTGHFFLISTGNFTPEAQNALLKTFEEPSKNTYLFILVSSISKILPTILSRCQVFNLDSENFSSIDLDLFLKQGFKDRLKTLEHLMEHPDNEEDEFSRLEEIEKFAKSLELKFSQSLDKTALSKIVLFNKYIKEPQSNKKMLLEFLAINLPDKVK